MAATTVSITVKFYSVYMICVCTHYVGYYHRQINVETEWLWLFHSTHRCLC